jgi:hypothetical protein
LGGHVQLNPLKYRLSQNLGMGERGSCFWGRWFCPVVMAE